MSADTYSKWEHQFNNNGDMRLTLLTVSIHWWTPNFIQFFALVKAQMPWEESIVPNHKAVVHNQVSNM